MSGKQKVLTLGDGFNPWVAVLTRSRLGEHPTRAELAALVREHGVPPDAREYVAARLEGDLHLGKLHDGGRPRRSWREQHLEWLWRGVLIENVDRRMARYSAVRLRRPRGKSVRVHGRSHEILPKATAGRSPAWVRAGNLWRLRSPLGVAIRQVAIRWGVDERRLRRWRRDGNPRPHHEPPIEALNLGEIRRLLEGRPDRQAQWRAARDEVLSQEDPVDAVMAARRWIEKLTPSE